MRSDPADDSPDAGYAAARRPYRLLAGIVALGLVAGLVAGLLASRIGRGDRITVGNTAGTLSAVVRVDGALVVVGGGDSRTDLSDLVGRATLPWDRRVDLLVVPGWDTQQVLGALGLIEGGNVRALAILGGTSDRRSLNLLTQAATQRDVAVSELDGEQHLRLGDGVDLALFAPLDGTDVPAALVRLDYHGNQIMLADIATSADRKTLSGWDGLPAETRLLIATRPFAPNLIRGDVVLRPAARQSGELEPLPPSFAGELRPGERLTIRLNGTTIRLPADRLRPQFATPGT